MNPKRPYGANSHGSVPTNPIVAEFNELQHLRAQEEKSMRCKGLIGSIFGHKFKVGIGEYVYKLDYCARYGFRP